MKRASHFSWRINAWATGLLIVAVLVAGNRLAREHLDLRHDLTEDQLFAPSPVGEEMLGALTDVLAVRAYFTGEVKLGPVQIAKRQLIDQLEDYVRLSRGRMALTFVDPNVSTEARVEARGLGIQHWRGSSWQGTAAVTQDTYFGLVLRYRGREEVLPWVLPQTLEYAFLSALNSLTREGDVAIGFVVGTGDGAPEDGFAQARALLAAQYRVVEVVDLARGRTVPENVAVLVVARPIALHPRAVFAVDQFVQRGGRVLLLVERNLVDLVTSTLAPVETGFEELLRRWGAPVGRGLVWDQERSNTISTYETMEVGGEERRIRQMHIQYPLWPNVGEEGLERSLPVTGAVPGADLFWAHEIEPSELVPRHAERRSLLRSTESSFVVDPAEALVLDPEELDRRAVNLLAGGKGRARELAVSLSGRFPSPFAEEGAPAPLDDVQEALWRELEAAALAEGREPPRRLMATTGEPVASEAATSQVVVVGDADWASDGKYFTLNNRMLLVNLVDWLALEDDLIALRSRIPTDRAIDDFLEEERTARGLVLPSMEDEDARERYSQLETEAANRAALRRWLHMALATGGSLLLAVLLGLAWRLTFGRPVREPKGEGR